MDSLNQDYVKKKKIYRSVFESSLDSVKKQLFDIKKYYLCNRCMVECAMAQEGLLDFYPESCTYRSWQKACLNKLENDISKDILFKIKEMLNQRNNYSCNNCAVCCNFASSEFSHEELLEKAKNGDKFAGHFTSIFIPYENKEQALKIYPEYVELINEQYQDSESVYFYHCPKLDENNLCSDYENRPDICKDFPDNPLAILPKTCGFCGWREDVEIKAMVMHALSEIVGYYIENLNKVLKKPLQ